MSVIPIFTLIFILSTGLSDRLTAQTPVSPQPQRPPLPEQLPIPGQDELEHLLIRPDLAESVEVRVLSADDLEIAIVNKMEDTLKEGGYTDIDHRTMPRLKGVVLHFKDKTEPKLFVFRWKPEENSRVRFRLTLDTFRYKGRWINVSDFSATREMARSILLLVKQLLENY